MSEQQATCGRCGRKLTAAASIARGYGPKCRTRIRRMAGAAAELGFKPHQVDSAVELIDDAAIVPLRTGRYVAVSSDGAEFYECSAEVCGCKAFENGRQCYHRLAVALLAA